MDRTWVKSANRTSLGVNEPTWEMYFTTDIETWSGIVIESDLNDMTYRSARENYYINPL